MKKSLFTLLLTLTLSTNGWGSTLDKVIALFKDGDYYGVILELDQKNIPAISYADRIYWIGLSYHKLEEYPKAAAYLEKALKNNYQGDSIYYELGQAYYALKSPKKAINYFLKSIKNKYETDNCFYYLGNLYKEVGKRKKSRRYFELVHESTFPNLHVVQAAHYQVGKLYYDGYIHSRILSRKILRKKVIPLYEQAIRSAPDSDLVAIIKQEISYIRQKHQLGESRWYLDYDQLFSYNSNVIYLATEPTVNKTNESGVIESKLNARYDYSLATNKPIKWRNLLTLDYDYHTNQDESSISRYDGFNFQAETSLEVKDLLFKNTDPLTVSFEFSQTSLDNQGDRSLHYDNSYWKIGAGQKLLFKKSYLEFKFSYLNYKNYTDENNYSALSFDITFPYIVNSRNMWLYSLFVELNDYSTNSTYSTNAYGLTLGYVWQINQRSSLNSNLTTKIIDTLELSSSRGTEILLTPSLNYEYFLKKNLTVGAQYQFSRKFSDDDASYSYSQHIVSLKAGLYYD